MTGLLGSGGAPVGTAAQAAADPAFAAGFAGPMYATQGASDAFPLRRAAFVSTLQRAGTVKQLRWLTFGSSVADMKIRELGPMVIRTFGGQQVGALIGSWGSSAGPAGSSASNITTNSTTGTAPTARTSDFDVWPSGLTTGFTQTGSATYGIGGGSPVCDTIEIYYVTGPATTLDGGTFSYQVDSGTVTQQSTTAGAQGIGRIVVNPTLGAHTLTLAWVSGNVRIVGVGFWDSAISGVLPLNCAQGGINLWASQPQAFANFQTWLGWVAPDVITFEMKDSQVSPSAVPGFTGTPDMTAFKAWLSAVAAASTVNAGPDVVIIGSTPASNNGPQYLMNQAQAAVAATYQPGLNAFGWDGYTPLGSYANVLAMGWQNDGTHLLWPAQNFLAGLLARDSGLFALAAAVNPRDTVAGTALLGTSLSIGPTAAPNFVATSTNPDIYLTSSRNVVFKDGSNNTVALFPLGSSGSDAQLPRYSRIGGGSYPFLYGADANNLAVGNSGGGGSPRDLIVRSVVMTPSTASVSGAVSVDLTNYDHWLITLTGNVTSFAFANGSSTNGYEVEVELIQDATGSRTLAGASGSIKWAGAAAPTLTTTAGRRDIFRFRYYSGSYYEISRSMNVG